MADHSAAVSTQERNPRSAVLRTVLAVAVAAFPLLNGILVALIEALKPYEAFVPGWVFLGLNGILLAVTALAAIVTRVLAVPGVNDWLRKYQVLRWFTPEDAPANEAARFWISGADVIVGEFQPSAIEDLTPEALAQIGKSFTWTCAGTVDSGRYAGQDMWSPTPHILGMAWVPRQDIKVRNS